MFNRIMVVLDIAWIMLIIWQITNKHTFSIANATITGSVTLQLIGNIIEIIADKIKEK